MTVPCLFAVSFLLAGDAAAQSAPAQLQAVSGGDIVPLIKARGDRYELKTDSAGDPLILGYNASLSHGYQVIFYDCSDGAACRTVQFRAWFKHTQDVPVAEMNEWNRSKRLGRAYLDQDQDPTIELTVRLHDGISTGHLADELDYFMRSMQVFQDQLGSRVE